MKKTLKVLNDKNFSYCSGCSHGVIHRLIAEVIEEKGLQNQTIGICSTGGCSTFMYDYFNIDFIESPTGKAPAVATGVKKVHPDKIVFTYQGDGDLVGSGINEVIHAAARSEKFTIIYVNNLISAGSGGQMSPTTLVGQITSTNPYGRSYDRSGRPIKISELISNITGITYISRVSVHTPKEVKKAKEYLHEAIDYQISGRGLSLIEFLSLCPTFWQMTPLEAKKWMTEKLVYEYPLGLIKKVVTK